MFDKKLLSEIRTPTDLFKSSSDILALGVSFVMADSSSRVQSEKIRDGNETKILKGEYPSMAPIGYLNVQPGKGIIPDPQKAFFIKRIFTLYDSGQHSIGGLVRVMYQEGLRSKRNNKLYKSSIERILKSPEYYGVILRKGVIYPGNHEPLITKALFDSVQKRLQLKTRSHVKSLFFLYREYLICHKCGCKLTATTKKGNHTYYYCTNSKNICDQHKRYIKESEMEELLSDLIKKFIPDKKILELSLQRYLRNKKSELAHQEKQSESVTKIIKTLEKRLTNLENMYLDERIDAQGFDVKKKEIQNELTDLKMVQKASLVTPKKDTLELVENFKNRVISLWQLFYDGNPSVKKEILESLLWNCGILNKKIITTRYKTPYSYMKKFHQTTDLEILSGIRDRFRTFFDFIRLGEELEKLVAELEEFSRATKHLPENILDFKL